MSDGEPHIKSEKRGVLGLLTLDRPQALNALDHGMIGAISAQLQVWAADDAIKTVAIRGEGARAFCSGGDIRAVQQWAVAGSDAGVDLLRDEYLMNALIGAYPKRKIEEELCRIVAWLTMYVDCPCEVGGTMVFKPVIIGEP